MAAGTAYSKRYAGGFVDKPTLTTPIDSTFLNAVEAALLQLIGSAPTADGQVQQWDFANTRFGPALILNKNVDPAAAIASSKIDFSGANGLTNAAIAGAAAIARSKLDFGAGLVNADISGAAAIALSKLAAYPANGSNVVISAANTDLALPGSDGTSIQAGIGTGGGTLRTIASARVGTRVVFQNVSGAAVTMKHQLAGGTGHMLYHGTGTDFILHPTCMCEYVHDGGSTWILVSSTNPYPRIEIGQSSVNAGAAQNFNFGRAFTLAPFAVANTTDASTICAVTGTSTTQIALQHNAGAARTVNWIAVGV